jgi:RNA polymerase sigma-70 factor (ECF subfamily)
MTTDSHLSALRAGDERAFTELAERHHQPMLRLARTFVPSDAVAEEVVQETWLCVLRQLDRFEGRSSVKTWLFRILVNRAKTRGVREQRSVPFASLALGGEDEPIEERLSARRPWCDPDRRLTSLETRAALRVALAALPPRQRRVVTLRDVEGLAAEDVCELLDLSPGNQRLLLHRARTRLRDQLAAVAGVPLEPALAARS